MDVDKAVKYLDDNAETTPQERCAQYVREALSAGGLKLTHPPASAKDYGPTLLGAGLTKFHEFRHIPPPTPAEAADHSISIKTGLTAYEERTGIISINLSGPIASELYVAKKGDVAVIQPYDGGNPNGHITMYDGNQWVSDFKQRDIWGGAGYRKHRPDCVIYRP